MKEKILAKLVAKYPGLPKEFLGFVAEKVAVTTTEESAIDTAIQAVESAPISLTDQAAYFQQEGDRRVTLALQKKGPAPAPMPAPAPSPAPAVDPNDPLAGLMQLVKNLSGQVETLTKGQQQKSLQERMAAKLLELKIPPQFAKGRIPEKEEDLDTVITEIQADFKAVTQHMVDEKLVTMPIPGGGGEGSGANGLKDIESKKVDDDIAAWSKKNQPILKTT